MPSDPTSTRGAGGEDRRPSLPVRVVLTAAAVSVVAPVGLLLLHGLGGMSGLTGRLVATGIGAVYLATFAVAVAVLWRTDLSLVPRMLVVLLLGGLAFLDLTMVPAILDPWLYGEALVGAAPAYLAITAWLGMGGAAALVGAALLRFSLYFPRPLRNEDIVVLLSEKRRHGSGMLDRYWSFSRRTLDRMPWLLGVANGLRDLGRSRWLAPLAGAIALPAALGPLGFVASAAGAYLLASAGMGNLLGAYSLADEQDRRKLLWVFIGVGPAMLAVLMYASMAMGFVTGFTEGDQTWASLATFFPDTVRWILGVPLMVGVLALVGALAFGIFRSGAIDPALVVRRTAVYGAVGGGVLFIFGVLEGVVSDALLDRAGLPPGLGTWVAAGASAMALAPLRLVLDRTVGTRVSSRLRTSGPLAEESEGAATWLAASLRSGEGAEPEPEAVSVFDKAVRKAANRHGGRVVDAATTEALLAFGSAEAAGAAATTIVDTVRVACEVLDLPAPDVAVGISDAAGTSHQARSRAATAAPGAVVAA